NEVRLLSLGRLRSRKMRTHNSVPLKGRRHGHCRVQEGAFASVAFRRKEGDPASVALPGDILHVAIKIATQYTSRSERDGIVVAIQKAAGYKSHS
ncbi:hypothetical protein Taro_055905, partial [Colocasia esculenta]|nr:hypothetical protein [Colocasia esculenta]